LDRLLEVGDQRRAAEGLDLHGDPTDALLGGDDLLRAEVDVERAPARA
jgi:hypothetical protein